MAQKSVFQGDGMQKLRKDLQEVADHSNYMRTQLSGFLAQMDGQLYSRISGQAQFAQSQINRLTDEAEQLSDFIRLAISKIQAAEQQTMLDARALMKGDVKQNAQGSILKQRPLTASQRASWDRWGNYAIQYLKDSFSWYRAAPIPTILFGFFRGLTLQIQRTTLIDRMQKYKGDAEVAALLQMMQQGSMQEQIEAQQKLEQISEALIEVGRCQAAYEVYKQFGQTAYMEGAHAAAEKARSMLSGLGMNRSYYDKDVNLRSEYTGAPLSACQYNPLKNDHSVMPSDDRLLTMIRLSMADQEYRKWAFVNYDDIVEEIRRADILAEIQKQLEANLPPTKLPDGTPITPDNKENETTFKYFQEHIQNDKMMNPLLEYLTWLDDTYGKTEWRKNVEMVDGVLRGFAEGLITETVNGVVGTLEFAFNFVVDPGKTTKEIVDTVSYLASNPEVLVEAAKKMYTDFESASPEKKAEMIGAVASMLVPGVSVTKVGKVEKVTEAMTSIAKKMKKIDYPTSVSRLQESFSNMSPYRLAMTPEGVMMMMPNTKKIDFGPSKPSSLHDGPNVSKIDGKGDPGKSGIEGTGEAQNIDLNRIGTGAVGDFQNVKDVNDLISRIPADAKQIPWREVPGGAKDGVKFRWIDEAGKTWDVRAHSVDPTAPSGSNAANGWIYRVEVKQVNPKWKWTMDSKGNFHKENVLRENSPHYDESIANDTHIPFTP
ncbi:polymorphic toxin type 30 domain-containing protein [Paenibacillus guangzhouensis]|uniref:polymorphic toxin type 30 domain-containing protein n=1 Tax=Paenibacillus guangzhouensis TaxID=1473112 RepID=UPI00187B8112|nr:polymorphic toxin type 30 domain-containing protein [Paenibacillus guangzhouensis]